MVKPNPLFDTVIKKQTKKMMASVPVTLLEESYFSHGSMYVEYTWIVWKWKNIHGKYWRKSVY